MLRSVHTQAGRQAQASPRPAAPSALKHSPPECAGGGGEPAPCFQACSPSTQARPSVIGAVSPGSLRLPGRALSVAAGSCRQISLHILPAVRDALLPPCNLQSERCVPSHRQGLPGPSLSPCGTRKPPHSHPQQRALWSRDQGITVHSEWGRRGGRSQPLADVTTV